MRLGFSIYVTMHAVFQKSHTHIQTQKIKSKNVTENIFLTIKKLSSFFLKLQLHEVHKILGHINHVMNIHATL